MTKDSVEKNVGVLDDDHDGFTRDEVIAEVKRWTGRELSVSNFYKWLPYAFISEPKRLYSKRDVQKILFISSEFKRVRRLITASRLLQRRLENNEEVFDHFSDRKNLCDC